MRSCPVPETGPLIIDEESPISDRRLFRYHFDLFPYRHTAFGDGCGISPVNKRADSHPFGQMKHAINRSPFVTSADEQQLITTSFQIRTRQQSSASLFSIFCFFQQKTCKYFILSSDLRQIYDSLLLQLLQQNTLSDGSKQYQRFHRLFMQCIRNTDDIRSVSRHKLHITGHLPCDLIDTLFSLTFQSEARGF